VSDFHFVVDIDMRYMLMPLSLFAFEGRFWSRVQLWNCTWTMLLFLFLLFRVQHFDDLVAVGISQMLIGEFYFILFACLYTCFRVKELTSVEHSFHFNS